MGNQDATGLVTGDHALDGFFSATQRRAFSLAFRITGDAQLAESATEAAYRRLVSPYSESNLFDAIRQEALAAVPKRSASSANTYVMAAAVRTTFESLGQLERSALELAHSGGMSVAAIAETLEEEPAKVRLALREALLRLGASAREEGNRS